jgi:hypothetical protein
MTQPNPNKCECGSQLFTAVWAVRPQDGYDHEEVEKKLGMTNKRPVGFECVECGAVQLTREVPQRHADDGPLDLPDTADRDMVREE